MLQQTTDVMTRDFRQSRVTVAGKQRLLTFPQRLVTVHTRTVIAIKRLRHKRRRLAKLMSSIANYVFEYLQIVRGSQHRRVTEVDLTLTRRRYLVVMALDSDATLAQRQRYFGSKIGE